MILRWFLVIVAFAMSHRTLFGCTLIGWLYKCWALHPEVENLEKFLRMSSKIVLILNNWGPLSSSILLFLYDDVFYIPIAGRHASDWVIVNYDICSEEHFLPFQKMFSLPSNCMFHLSHQGITM